jgi:hypothetical protein
LEVIGGFQFWESLGEGWMCHWLCRVPSRENDGLVEV